MSSTNNFGKSSCKGGIKLRDISNFLVRESLIKEDYTNQGVGSQKRVYSIVE